MKNPLWSAVFDLVQEVDTLFSRAERFGAGGAAGSSDAPPSDAPSDAPPSDAPAEPAIAASSPKRGKAGFFKAYVATDDLVEVRSKLRAKLDLLKAQLAENLTEREVFLVLFPLVVLFDELVQNRFVAGGGSGSWPPLQSELFKIDDGGEVFYNTLDDLIRKPDTLPFVYEVFYLCLSLGFRGRYADNLTKVNEYKHKIETKIPLPVLPKKSADDVRGVRFTFKALPFLRYVGVAAILAIGYTLLRVIAVYANA
jgi:type IV/VI secretion system ImpK/VasF family protein